MTTVFLPATLSEAELCAHMHQLCFERPWSRVQIEGSLLLASTQGWVIVHDQRPAGFILYQEPPQETEILTFCIVPDMRGRGLGAQLLHKTIAAAQMKASQKIYLEVAEDNGAAIGLYHKLGFEFIGRRANYYKTPKGPVAALLYQLPLNPLPVP